MTMTDPAKEAALRLHLQTQTPLFIMQFLQGQLAWPNQAELDRLGQIIAAQGDSILFRVGKPGQTAEAVTALAKVVAILAFTPGGVTCFGTHFEVPLDEAKVFFDRQRPMDDHSGQEKHDR